jgi:hypothetical protein
LDAARQRPITVLNSKADVPTMGQGGSEMERIEASELLHDYLNSWRRRSYQELVNVVGESHQAAVKGASGADYQVDVQVVWDGQTHGSIRVIGSIDDGGWRAFVPLTEAFILAPDGSFVGE